MCNCSHLTYPLLLQPSICLPSLLCLSSRLRCYRRQPPMLRSLSRTWKWPRKQHPGGFNVVGMMISHASDSAGEQMQRLCCSHVHCSESLLKEYAAGQPVAVTLSVWTAQLTFCCNRALPTSSQLCTATNKQHSAAQHHATAAYHVTAFPCAPQAANDLPGVCSRSHNRSLCTGHPGHILQVQGHDRSRQPLPLARHGRHACAGGWRCDWHGNVGALGPQSALA